MAILGHFRPFEAIFRPNFPPIFFCPDSRIRHRTRFSHVWMGGVLSVKCTKYKGPPPTGRILGKRFCESDICTHHRYNPAVVDPVDKNLKLARNVEV